MMTMDGELSRMLLKLYRAAREMTPLEFQAYALHVLQQQVPFEGAIWGSGRLTPSHIDVADMFEFDADRAAADAWRELDGPRRDKVVAPGVRHPLKAFEYMLRFWASV